MGWFSDAVSKVKSVAKSAWEGAKKIAIQAVGWMAEKAETFIGDVKDVWNKVKPFVRTVLKTIQVVAPWPWVKAAAKGLEKAIDWIERMENTAFARKLKAAIDWVIQAAKDKVTDINKKILSGEELKAAHEREDVFKEAERILPLAERKEIIPAELINKFIVVQSLIEKTFNQNTIKDFDHYMRLRATQKLLASSRKGLNESKNIESIGDDDVFLLNIAREFMSAKPTVSEADLNRLNSLIYSRFNKKELIPFVFEEMIVAWAKNLVDLDQQWKTENKALAKNIVQLRTLENVLEMGGKLDAEQNSSLLQLRKTIPSLKVDHDALEKSNREMRNYVYAAEGFLEVVEGAEFLEGKEYLAAQGSNVGMIIIQCAQYGKKWETLKEEEQELIIDFANIFKTESIKRVERVERELRVEVAA